MNSEKFPWIALGIGLLISALLLQGQAGAEDGLPLLTKLILAEFGFLVTAIGGALGVRTVLREGVRPPLLMASIGCVLLALGLLLLGFSFWPDTGPG